RVAHADIKKPLTCTVGRKVFRKYGRLGNQTVRIKLMTEVAGEIRHVIEFADTALVYPALQLLGTERLATPLRHKLGECGSIHSQQIGARNDGGHSAQCGRPFWALPVLTA